MVEKCSIRKFEIGDLQRLHEIREAAYRSIFHSFKSLIGEKIASIAITSAEREQSDYLDTICRSESHRELYVVEYESKIIAFCAVRFDHKSKVGELDLNAVDPDYQRCGIGTWMYSFALDRMKNAGMTVATVGVGGDLSHAPARRAYEKAGFGPAIPSVHLYKLL